jgi:hypothetical protein
MVAMATISVNQTPREIFEAIYSMMSEKVGPGEWPDFN